MGMYLDPKTTQQVKLGVNAMRPFINKKGQGGYFTSNGKLFVPAQNAVLRYDEWKALDSAVVKVTTERLVGIASLKAKGLVFGPLGLGTILAGYEQQSDITDAQFTMDGKVAGEKGNPDHDLINVPVPLIIKDFDVGLRTLEASRRNGTPFDTTVTAMATRKVAEACEDMLFTTSTIKVAGETIYGYLNHPSRNTVSLGTDWASVTTANNYLIVNKVLEMIQAAINDGYMGPYELYIPGEYSVKMEEDYVTTNSNGKTLMDRIKAISTISDVKIADRMATGNVALVQMTSDVVDLALGEEAKTIQWSNNGGMTQDFRVMACMAPRVKSEYSGKSGIVHAS